MREKILIVEDEEEIAMLEQDYLEINGFQTRIESDGEQAVELALTGEFDLILLDLMLPGKNGYDICRDPRQSGCSDFNGNGTHRIHRQGAGSGTWSR